MCVLLTILVSVVIGLVSCQAPESYHRPSQGAAILSDARYLAGDGTFGAAYSQEDGVEFKEESDEYGNRKGSYSYVDPTGQRRTVSYTAGVDGFKATGDHIPTAPPQVAPQPEYVPLPQYNPPDYKFPQQQYARPKYQPEYPRYQESSFAKPEYHRYQEPSIAKPVYHPPPLRFETRYSPEHQYTRPVPRPAYYHPLRRPYQPVSPVPQYHAPAEYPSRYYPQYQPPVSRQLHRYNDITTPAPRRFNPPGKLDFYRTPDGFSYTFSKS